MRTHDIICEEEGWVQLVDGVRIASFPTWLMALDAARCAAAEDAAKGIDVICRAQGSDGRMRAMQPRVKPSKPMTGLKIARAVDKAKDMTRHLAGVRPAHG